MSGLTNEGDLFNPTASFKVKQQNPNYSSTQNGFSSKDNGFSSAGVGSNSSGSGVNTQYGNISNASGSGGSSPPNLTSAPPGSIITPNSQGGSNIQLPSKVNSDSSYAQIITPNDTNVSRIIEVSPSGSSQIYQGNLNLPQGSQVTNVSVSPSNSIGLNYNSPSNSSGIYNSPSGPMSIAPILVEQQSQIAQNKGTVFINSQGQGFSQNPDTVPVGVSYGNFGVNPIMYASGRQEVTPESSNIINVYGMNYSRDNPMFQTSLPSVQSTSIVNNFMSFKNNQLDIFNKNVASRQDEFLNYRTSSESSQPTYNTISKIPIGSLSVLSLGVNVFGAPIKSTENFLYGVGSSVVVLGSGALYDVVNLNNPSIYPFSESSYNVKNQVSKLYSETKRDPLGVGVEFSLLDVASRPLFAWGSLAKNSFSNFVSEKGIFNDIYPSSENLFSGSNIPSGTTSFVKNSDLKNVINLQFGGGAYESIIFRDAFSDFSYGSNVNNVLSERVEAPFNAVVHIAPNDVLLKNLPSETLSKQANANIINPVISEKTTNIGVGTFTITSSNEANINVESGINAKRLKNDLTNFYVAPESISPILEQKGFINNLPAYNIISKGQAQGYLSYAFGTSSFEYDYNLIKGTPTAYFGVSKVSNTPIVNNNLFETSMNLNYNSEIKGGSAYISPENLKGIGFSREFQLVQIADKTTINRKFTNPDVLLSLERPSNNLLSYSSTSISPFTSNALIDSFPKSKVPISQQIITTPTYYTYVKYKTTNPFDSLISNLDKPIQRIESINPSDNSIITKSIPRNPLFVSLSKSFLSIPKGYLDLTMPKYQVSKINLEEVYYTEKEYIPKLDNLNKKTSFSMGGASAGSSQISRTQLGVSDYLKNFTLVSSLSNKYSSNSFYSSRSSSNVISSSFSLSKSLSSSGSTSKSSSLSSSYRSISSRFISSSQISKNEYPSYKKKKLVSKKNIFKFSSSPKKSKFKFDILPSLREVSIYEFETGKQAYKPRKTTKIKALFESEFFGRGNFNVPIPIEQNRKKYKL